jgi:hypothetical protein
VAVQTSEAWDGSDSGSDSAASYEFHSPEPIGEESLVHDFESRAHCEVALSQASGGLAAPDAVKIP